MPDKHVVEWEHAKQKDILCTSLHQFIANYMTMENSLAERFKTSEPDTVYYYACHYEYDNPTDHDDYNIIYDRTFYSSYDAVICAIREVLKEGKSNHCTWKSRSFSVYKSSIDTKSCLSVNVDPNGEIISEWDGWSTAFSKEKSEDFYALGNINLYVPVPFRKGDILRYRGWGKPFVLESNDWKYGKNKFPNEMFYLAEGNIMDTIYCSSIQDNGNVFSDFNPASLELEFYKEKLEGLNRALKPISNHLKGELDVDLMMNAYDIIVREEKLKDRLGNLKSWYTEKGRSLVGLRDDKA
jgi:hypothetical protein